MLSQSPHLFYENRAMYIFSFPRVNICKYHTTFPPYKKLTDTKHSPLSTVYQPDPVYFLRTISTHLPETKTQKSESDKSCNYSDIPAALLISFNILLFH